MAINQVTIAHLFLVGESATTEMAFPDVCLKVRKSEKKITLEARD
jgi:hypothetical protein